MHLFPGNPKIVPSHASPGSTSPLPHFGFGMQDDVSSLQFVHFKAPPVNELMSVQSFITPNMLPSHVSPMSILLSPQVPCVPWHFVASSLQLLSQLKLPPENVVA